MSKVNIVFNYKGEKYTIECNTFDKINEICKRFSITIKKDITELCFAYNDKVISMDLKNEKKINELNEISNNMEIKVNEINRDKDKEKLNINTINNNTKDYNYIISEINIEEKDLNQDIRIINSYEQFKREYKDENFEGYGNDESKYENEEEIKNCKIKINDVFIPFTYFHKFTKVGKYSIKYIFVDNITKMDYMFYNCELLSFINLSNLNAQNVINISDIFFDCNSLVEVNLFKEDTPNLVYMAYAFSNCNSLANIDLSKLNTRNVTDMSNMFGF